MREDPEGDSPEALWRPFFSNYAGHSHLGSQPSITGYNYRMVGGTPFRSEFTATASCNATCICLPSCADKMSPVSTPAKNHHDERQTNQTNNAAVPWGTRTNSPQLLIQKFLIVLADHLNLQQSPNKLITREPVGVPRREETLSITYCLISLMTT